MKWIKIKIIKSTILFKLVECLTEWIIKFAIISKDWSNWSTIWSTDIRRLMNIGESGNWMVRVN
jgi:hypothetical protein